LETFYNGFGGGWRWRGFGDRTVTTTTDVTKIGTLIVDIFDTQTQKLIWRGKQSDALSGNPNKNEKSSQRTLLACSSTFLRHIENEECLINYMELEDGLLTSSFNHRQSSGR